MRKQIESKKPTTPKKHRTDAAPKPRQPKSEASTEDTKARTPKRSRKGGKLATVVAMLRRPKGASVDELSKATGWQTHSVRGAISGAVKKKMGLTVTSSKSGDVRRYCVTD